MVQNTFSKLTSSDLEQLYTSLHFLKIDELRTILRKLEINDKGKKIDLLERIFHFIKTGKVKVLPKIPDVSRAKRGQVVPIQADSLILKGSYKNDLETRLFFKYLIGDHFHFTAFGIDWIEQRWLEGKPPTYQEYAEMWKAEQTRRKKQKAQPKQEWALINFALAYAKKHPKASRDEILARWHIERERHVQIVEKLLLL